MAEGVFPKTDGDVLYATDVNYISKSVESAFKTRIELEYTSSPSPKIWENNMFVDIFKDNSKEDTKTGFVYMDLGSCGLYFLDNGTGTYRTIKVMSLPNSISYSYLYANYQVLNLLDNFEDAVIGTDWTTAGAGDNYSVTETTDGALGGILNLYIDGDGNSTYAEAVYTGVNYYQTTKKIYCLIKLYGTGAGDGTYRIIMTDGTTDITLKSWAEASLNEYHLMEIVLNGTANTADVYIDGVLDSSGIDLSTLGTTWNIKFRLSGTSTYTMRMYLYWLSDDNISSPTTTITGKVSTDDGTTWEDVNVNNFYKLINTGKEVRIGWNATLGTGEMLVIYNHGFLGV